MRTRITKLENPRGGVIALKTKVLVIDDDTAMTDLFKLTLGPKGFDVITANSAADGIAAIKQHHPDVVVLDLLMPGEDGWETCGSIRKFSNVPILVLSALSSPGLTTRLLDAGADDYLIKPVSTRMLIAQINKLCRRSNVSPPTSPTLKEL
jgi:DNA-binding response OmpR family regulator